MSDASWMLTSVLVTLPRVPGVEKALFERAAGSVLRGSVDVSDGRARAVELPDGDTWDIVCWTRSNWEKGGDRKEIVWELKEWSEFLSHLAASPDTSVTFGGGVYRQSKYAPVVVASHRVRFHPWKAAQGAPHAGSEHYCSFAIELMCEREVSGYLPAAMSRDSLLDFIAELSQDFEITHAQALDEQEFYFAGWDNRVACVPQSTSVLDSRRYLRGYAWVTYCPGHLLDTLGGVAAAETSGVFFSVRELGHGLVELRATQEATDYTLSHVRQVHEFFAPILRPCEPDLPADVRRDHFNPAAPELWK